MTALLTKSPAASSAWTTADVCHQPRALVVELAGRRVAVPLEDVVEILPVQGDWDVQPHADARTLVIRGEDRPASIAVDSLIEVAALDPQHAAGPDTVLLTADGRSLERLRLTRPRQAK